MEQVEKAQRASAEAEARIAAAADAKEHTPWTVVPLQHLDIVARIPQSSDTLGMPRLRLRRPLWAGLERISLCELLQSRPVVPLGPWDCTRECVAFAS